MSIVVPDVGEVLLLSYCLNKVSPTDVKLHLFVSDVTPDDDTVLADLTEAVDGSYAAITLTGASWTVATLSGITTASYAQQTFNFTNETDVYGYYVTNNAGSGLLWVERIAGSPVTVAAAGNIKITPKFTGD